MPQHFDAQKDDRLAAHVIRSSPLTYDNEAHPEAKSRPDHVRAASSLVHLVDRFALVQDDANFLGLVDPDDHHVRGVPLPPAPDGARVHEFERDNYEYKLDLEACACDPRSGGELLVAFGSGSHKTREWIITVDWRDKDHDGLPDTALVETPAFHGMLRQNRDFAGSGLNVEGAVFVDDDRLRLLQRGNAEPHGDLQPIDATGDVCWSDLWAYLDDPTGTPPPPVTNVVQYNLGTLHNVRLTFSDAEFVDGVTLFSASAENEETDEIVGSVLGIIGPDGETRWAELFGEDGAPFTGKVEGLSTKPDGNPHHVYFVIDSDDADRASRIYEAELEGPWFGAAE